MSETRKILKDKLPIKIYLDTTFLVDVLIETKQNKIKHEKAYKFAERLKQSKTTIILSKFSFIEFWSAVFKIRSEYVCGNKKFISIIKSQKFTQDVFEWSQKQYRTLILFLEELTKRPDSNESVGIFGMGTRIHDKAREAAVKYKLPIYDAIHYNTMLETNTAHIVTENIDDFRHLNNIYIWSYR